MNEEERIKAAWEAINLALEMFQVDFVWEYEDEGEMWLECRAECDIPQNKPTLTVVQ